MVRVQRPLLADVDDLAAWIGEEIESGSPDEARAQALLARASEIVRAAAARTWLDQAGELDEVPFEIHGVVVELAATGWFNVAGWDNARFAEFSFGVGEPGMVLTPAQRATVARYRDGETTPPRAGIGVISTTRSDPRPVDEVYWVPTVGGPLFPWWAP